MVTEKCALLKFAMWNFINVKQRNSTISVLNVNSQRIYFVCKSNTDN